MDVPGWMFLASIIPPSEAWEVPQDANAGASQHLEMLLTASALLTLILIGQDTKARLPSSPPAAWIASCLSVCLSVRLLSVLSS